MGWEPPATADVGPHADRHRCRSRSAPRRPTPLVGRSDALRALRAVVGAGPGRRRPDRPHRRRGRLRQDAAGDRVRPARPPRRRRGAPRQLRRRPRPPVPAVGPGGRGAARALPPATLTDELAPRLAPLAPAARQRRAARARPAGGAGGSRVGRATGCTRRSAARSRGGGDALADGRRARRPALGGRADARPAPPRRPVRAADRAARRGHVPRHRRRDHRAARRLSRRPPPRRRRRPGCASGASTTAAVERFVADAIGHPLDADFEDLAAELGTRSGGNAFYVVELWRHLVGTGAVAALRRPLGRRRPGGGVRPCPTASARSSPPGSPGCRPRRGE